MGEPTTAAPRNQGQSPSDRLDSWKEIAAYLHRDITTVQRWEKREGMPVHRHLHDKKGSVYAFRADLDAWMRTRNFRDDDEDELPDSTPTHALDTPSPADTSAPPSRSGLYLSIAALVAIVAAASFLWSRNTEYFWRSPIAGANLQSVTNFGGIEEAAAVSRDGKLVVFLSDRDGPMDVWLTQVGSGEFHNLTHGSAPSLVNPSVRTLGFSPDGSLVTFWTGRQNNSRGQDISIWAVPALGGQPRLYFENVAELDWSRDGSRVAYHTPGPGDPLYISDGPQQSQRPPIFTAPTGLHAHFPLWSPDGEFIYFVQGTLPDKLDILAHPSPRRHA